MVNGLVLILLLSSLFAIAEMWSLPSIPTPSSSMYEMCLESDIHQIEELKDSLDEHFKETSLNVDNADHIQSFGLLEEDWKRLHLLENRIPEGSVLKHKLVIAFRILVAALYQAHGNKENELGVISNEQENDQREQNSVFTDTLAFGESRVENVIVNPSFTSDQSREEIPDESTEFGRDFSTIPGETHLPSGSVGLTTSFSQTLNRTKTESKDDGEINVLLKYTDEVIDRGEVLKDTRNNTNNLALPDLTTDEESVSIYTEKENVNDRPVKTNDIFQDENDQTTTFATPNFKKNHDEDGAHYILPADGITENPIENTNISTYDNKNEEYPKTVVLNSFSYHTENKDKEGYDMDYTSSSFSETPIQLLESTIDKSLSTSSQNTEIMSNQVAVTKDSWGGNQVYEELHSLMNRNNIPTTTTMGEIQETKNSKDNDEIALNINESSKFKTFEDNTYQTIQETEIEEPTVAASDSIYSFVNFPIFTNNKSNEKNSNENDSLENSTKDTSTGSPISLYDDILNNTKTMYNKINVPEDKVTYDGKTINSTYENQDISEDRAETTEDENKQNYSSHEKFQSTRFDESEQYSILYDQTTVTHETHSIINSHAADSMELSHRNNNSALDLEGKNKMSDLRENDNGPDETHNENISETNSYTMSTTPSHNHNLVNGFQNPDSYENIQFITQIPSEMVSDNIDSRFHMIESTQNFKNHTFITDNNNKQNHSFESNITGDSTHEINYSLESPDTDLFPKDENMQSNFVNEKEIVTQENRKPKSDMKEISNQQEENLSVASTEAKSSSVEENISAMQNNGESGESKTLHGGNEIIPGEEKNKMESSSIEEEEQNSNSTNIFGSNHNLNPSPRHSYTSPAIDKRISSVDLRRNTMENEMTTPENLAESGHKNQLSLNSTEEDISTGDSNEHDGSIEQEIIKPATNHEERLLWSNEEPLSSIEDDKVQSGGKEEEALDPASNERSFIELSTLSFDTYSHTSKTETPITELSLALSEFRDYTKNIKDFENSSEKHISVTPSIEFEDMTNEKHSNEESKGNPLLYETYSNFNFPEENYRDSIHPEVVDGFHPSGSESRILTAVVKQEPDNTHESTEASNESFRTFSIALHPVEEKYSPTETYNELNIYPKFKYPYRISNFESSKGCRDTNDCVRVQHIEYKQSDNDFNKRREKRVNHLTNPRDIGNIEKRENRLKYLLSQIEDEIWQQKLKALKNSFVEYPGPPEKTT